jgi:hypothetical protein
MIYHIPPPPRLTTGKMTEMIDLCCGATAELLGPVAERKGSLDLRIDY